MSTYQVYESYVQELTRRMRKTRCLPENVSAEEMESVIARHTIESDGGATARALLMERLHRRTGSQVYFIEDARLVNFLEESSFQIDPAALVLPAPVISIAVPSGLPDTAGFLIGITTPEQFFSDARTYGKWAGYPEVPTASDFPPTTTIALSVPKPGKGSGRFRIGIPLEEIDQALQGDWFRNIQPEHRGALTDSEIDLQVRYLRLGLRLLAYMSAFPGQVRAGLPADSRHVPACITGRQAQTITLHPKLRDSPSAHLRRGHFRSLRHERFHRDRHGNIRIIYINPSLVGFPDATPSTVATPPPAAAA